MNAPSEKPRTLSALAEGLVYHLQTYAPGEGGSAEPSVYPGSGALATHAIAYLSNASQLCGDDAVHDFSVFGAFYCMRHGLELWLKYIVQNQTIDRTLVEIFKGDADSLDALGTAIGLTGNSRNVRLQQLCTSMCALRNLWEDKLSYPEVWTENIDHKHAARAIRLMRTRGAENRDSFARLWRLPVPGHSVKNLWDKARPTLVEFERAAQDYASEQGGGSVYLEQMEAAVDFVDYFDPDGDAFRYPASLAGDWYLRLPAVNLKKLGELANDLEQTVRNFEGALEESYEFAKLRSPEPSPRA